MAAYVIANVDVHDPTLYTQYRQGVQATLDKYNGRFLVRGGDYQILEGDWQPTRLVVLEFENVEAAHRWYDSPEYDAIKPFRQQAAKSDIIIVEGFSS